MADNDPKVMAEAYRQMLMGREPVGLVSKDSNLGTLSRVNTTPAQQRAKGNPVSARWLDGATTKDARSYRDVRGGK
jgi:hypothetical protein